MYKETFSDSLTKSSKEGKDLLVIVSERQQLASVEPQTWNYNPGKYVLHFPFPHQSMLDTPGKRQNTRVSLNIVQGRGGDNYTVWTPKCSITFFQDCRKTR